MRKGLFNLHYYPLPGTGKFYTQPRQNLNPILFIQVISIQAIRPLHSQLMGTPHSDKAYCPHASSCGLNLSKQRQSLIEGRTRVGFKSAKRKAVSPSSSTLRTEGSPDGCLSPVVHIPLSATCPRSPYCHVLARAQRAEFHREYRDQRTLPAAGFHIMCQSVLFHSSL